MNTTHTQISGRGIAVFTFFVLLLTWGQLLWDHNHGGVPSHHLLHRADLPAISNWWSGILLPVFTAMMLVLVARREKRKQGARRVGGMLAIALLLILGVLSGLTLTFMFQWGWGATIQFFLLGLVALSFLLPLYRPAFILGWVLGLAWAFGGPLSIGFGLVCALAFFVTYKVIRGGVVFLVTRLIGNGQSQ